jgi:hypothetical protein
MMCVGAAKVVVSTPCNRWEHRLLVAYLGDKHGKVDEVVQDLITISDLFQGIRSMK